MTRSSIRDNKIVLAIIAILAVIIIAVVAVMITGSNSKLKRCIDLGNKYLEAGDYASALAEFDKAIGIEPKDEDGYLGKIAALLGISDGSTDPDVSFESVVNAYIALLEGIENTGSDEAFDKSTTEVMNKIYAAASKVAADGKVQGNIDLADLILNVPQGNKAELDAIIKDLGDIIYPNGQYNGIGDNNGSNNAGNDADSNGDSLAGGDSSDGTGASKDSSEWGFDFNEVRAFGLSATDIFNMSADEFESYALGSGLPLNHFRDFYAPDSPTEGDYGHYEYSDSDSGETETLVYFRRYNDKGFGISAVGTSPTVGRASVIEASRAVTADMSATESMGIIWIWFDYLDQFGEYVSFPDEMFDINASDEQIQQWFIDRGVEVRTYNTGNPSPFYFDIPLEYLPAGATRGVVGYNNNEWLGRGIMIEIN